MAEVRTSDKGATGEVSGISVRIRRTIRKGNAEGLVAAIGEDNLMHLVWIYYTTIKFK